MNDIRNDVRDIVVAAKKAHVKMYDVKKVMVMDVPRKEEMKLESDTACLKVFTEILRYLEGYSI